MTGSMKNRWFVAAAAGLFAFAGTATAEDPKPVDVAKDAAKAAIEKVTPADKPVNIVKTAQACKEHKTFAKLVEVAGLAETLSDEKAQFTVFAPTDAAFEKLGKETLDSLMKPENKEKLQNILKHHVLTGTHKAAEVTTMKTVKPLAGPELTITTADKKVLIGNATITQTDVIATNGVIHVLDTVLVVE